MFCAAASVVRNNNVSAYLILFIELDAAGTPYGCFELADQNGAAIHIQNLASNKTGQRCA